MKYINLVNEFWRQNAIEPFSPTDIAVYFYLLNQCNLRHWENPFAITSHQIELALGITRKTVLASRKRLEKRGLLTVETQRHRPMTVTLIDCSGDKEEQTGDKSGHIEGTNPGQIAPHIKRDKNKEKRVIKKHSIECKKSKSETQKNDIFINKQNVGSDKPDVGIDKPDVDSHIKKDVSARSEVGTTSADNTARYVAFCDWVAENTPYVARHLRPLTEEQFFRLKQRFGSECLARNVDNLENRRDLRSRYTSLYRTLLNWCAKDIPG